jgi:signal transduction histidine kinase
LLAVALLYSTRGAGQPLKRLNHISYNINEGLLHSKVIDLAEDGNGLIWVSTGNGVQRFDGKQFHTVPTGNGLPDDKYVKFFTLKNKNLWFIHSSGVSEYDINTGRFRFLFSFDKTQSTKYSFPCSELADEIWWVDIKNNFYRQDKQTLRFTDSLPLSGDDSFYKPAFWKPPHQLLPFISHDEKQLLLFDPQSRKTKNYVAGIEQGQFIGAVHYKPDTFLVATNRGIEKLDLVSGKFLLISPYKTKSPSLFTNVYIRLHTAAGLYFVSEGVELYQLDPGKKGYVFAMADKQNRHFVKTGFITGLFADRYSNLWVLSENDGIYKVYHHSRGFRFFGAATPGKSFIKTIYADKADNLVLCGTQGDGLLVFDTLQQLLKQINDFPGTIAPHTISAIQKTATHQYLVFIAGNWKTFLLNTQTFSLQPVKADTGFIGVKNVFDYHMNVFPLGKDEYAMQNSFGIYKFNWHPPGTIRFVKSHPLSVASVSSYKDRQGRLWVGGLGKYFLFDKNLDSLKIVEPGEKIMVRCFYNDRTGHLWMGTEKGLYRLTEKGEIVKKFYKTDGLADENIYAIRDDNNGNLWFSHNKGISCMKKDGSFIHYNKEDGLQENEFNTNVSYETNDGELFFGGVNGISSFYPAVVLRNPEKPEIMLSSIRVKEEEWKSDTAVWNITRIDLPWSKNSISFEFSAMGPRQPDQYMYQYRMKGLEEEWVNSHNRGWARYLLPPGHYVFEIYAGNSYEKKAAPLKKLFITVRPPFWKTSWFITLSVIFMAAATIIITRYLARMKLKRKIVELEKKRVLDEERLRISREMHDDIGAGLTRITMLSESAKKATTNEEQLTKIAATSRQLVQDMGEIIWSMNQEHNTLSQLLAYLREQLRLLLEYSGIAYTIDFPENTGHLMLNNSQKRNLLLVAKEIVHNTVKHSGASHLSVLAEQKKSSIRFTITDDGCGFDTHKPIQGNGLRNIRRRVEESGGKLQIDASPGKGSRFSYEIPLTSF